MAHITADRVRDTTTTTGTGALTVSGSAPSGYQSFSSVLSTGDTCYYAVQHQAAAEWEVGLGTYSSSNTITRTTVYASSNSGSAVDFSAGTKDIFITLAASRTVQKDNSGNITGLVIGTNVQAWDADLDAIGGISATSGLLKKTAANTWSLDTTSYGYLNVPQVGGAAKTSSYTAVLGDAGSMITMNGASLTATIPANSSVAFPVGTVLTFVNIYAGNLSIAITTDTMTLVNTASTTGTRALAQNGIATAVKVSSTSWIISGSGLT